MKALKWIPNITVNTRALIILPQALLKQRDKCVSLLKKAKKVLPKFGWENVIDNKKSWKTVKHLLSENSITREKIKWKYVHIWIWNSRNFEYLFFQI